jgi:hypothetical protein
MKNHNIPVIDWCLIQYLIGFNINPNYYDLSTMFKILLKEYILFFNITTISSRDKKFLLQEFLNKYHQFKNNEILINEIINKYLNYKPNDDLIIATLKIFTFNWIILKLNKIHIFKHFIYENNSNLLNLFETICNKIITQ